MSGQTDDDRPNRDKMLRDEPRQCAGCGRNPREGESACASSPKVAVRLSVEDENGAATEVCRLSGDALASDPDCVAEVRLSREAAARLVRDLAAE